MNMSHPLQETASIDKWIDAPTRRVDAAGATFVYRRLGPATGVPVILLNHWGAALDNFDPRTVGKRHAASRRPERARARSDDRCSGHRPGRGQKRRTARPSVLTADHQ